MNKVIKILIFVCAYGSLGCIPINTDDPDKAFKYWTGIPLENSEVKALNGRYWKSAHFTYEYEAYLELIASKGWRDQLIEFNSLEIDTTTRLDNIGNAPAWFNPPPNYKKYTSTSGLDFHIWIQHPEGDTIYIYNRQF